MPEETPMALYQNVKFTIFFSSYNLFDRDGT